MKIHVVAKDGEPLSAHTGKQQAHESAFEVGLASAGKPDIAVTAVQLDPDRFTALDLFRAAADRANAKWPKPWEGGSHLFRYLGAAVRHSDSQWKVTEDADIDGFRINPVDASEAIKMAGALLRFFEQVGPAELARVAGMDNLVPAFAQPKRATAKEVAEGLAEHFRRNGQMG